MKDPAHVDFPVGEGVEGSPLGEGSNSDHPAGFEDLDQPPQVRVTSLEQWISLSCREFVRCSIASRLLDEHERAVVGDEVLLEEALGSTIVLRDRAPETGAADFATRGIYGPNATTANSPISSPCRMTSHGTS